MKAIRKKVLWVTGLLLTAFLAYFFYYAALSIYVAASLTAKVTCSGVFVSERSAEDMLDDDLTAFNWWLNTEVDYKEESVSSDFFGYARRKAIYRPGLGCTLVLGYTENRIRSQPPANPAMPTLPRIDVPWPNGDLILDASLPEGVNEKLLKEAVDSSFDEPSGFGIRRTRAVIVLYKGKIIAEKYAPGFYKTTKHLSWSATKSIINALIGVLVKQGKLDISKPAPVPEWSDPEDPRHAITVDQLLRMSSGLKFKEHYANPMEDVDRMLFNSGDTAGYAARRKLLHPPDTVYYYSSGTTNILSRMIKHIVGPDLNDYWPWPRKVLFDKIGMTSAVLEPDAVGTFIGSSYLYATARDWARFGLLYLNDGVWNGERILPEGWVKYSSTPTPTAKRAHYGAHFWTNGEKVAIQGDDKFMLYAPRDTYTAWGFEDQYISIVPSRDLVAVRLGQCRIPYAWDQSLFIKKVIKALPE